MTQKERRRAFEMGVLAMAFARDSNTGSALAGHAVIAAVECYRHVPADEENGANLYDYADEFVDWVYGDRKPTWMP